MKISKINNTLAGVYVHVYHQATIVSNPTDSLETKINDKCNYHTNGGTLRTIGLNVNEIVKNKIS